MKKLLALILLIPGAVYADTLTLNVDPGGLTGGPVTIHDLPVGNTVTGRTGPYQGIVNGTGAILPPGSQTPFPIYCVDTKDVVNFGNTWNIKEYGALPGAPALPPSAALPFTVANSIPLIAAAMDVTAMNPGTGVLNFNAGSLTEQTGLQLALWHLEYRGLVPIVLAGLGAEFTSVNPAGALAYADSIVNYLIGLTPAALANAEAQGQSQLILFLAVNADNSRDGGQDMISFTPEPASAMLLGMGGIGIGIAGLFRKKKKSPPA